MNEVDRNYNWYKKNLTRLLKEYKNKYIVIKDEQILFSSDNMEQAVTFASELELGTFIIQKCEKEDETNIQVFHTRAIF